MDGGKKAGKEGGVGGLKRTSRYMLRDTWINIKTMWKRKPRPRSAIDAGGKKRGKGTRIQTWRRALAREWDENSNGAARGDASKRWGHTFYYRNNASMKNK